MNYRVETEEMENGKGYWSYLKVHVMKGEEKIGEYTRNYSTLFDTFFPFELNGKEYALYSTHYTATRVMSLPDCKDIAGEEPLSHGFCPTGFYVPKIDVPYPLPDESDPEPSIDTREWVYKAKQEDGSTHFHYPNSEKHPLHSPEFVAEYKAEQDRISALKDEWDKRHPYTEIYAPFGFLSGCQWGDDSSWKIQFLDLSKIEEGILTRDDRFGYIELPSGLKLKDAIDTGYYDYDCPYINIAVAKRFKLTGEEDE